MTLAPQELELEVTRRAPEAEGIARIELRRAGGGPLPAFTAGAHVEVVLGQGLRRQYSLVNDPEDSDLYLLGVLLEAGGRGGSAAMHALSVGDRLRVVAPRNHFPIEPTASHHLLLGGGIGVTPLLSMAAQLHREGASFELHYCVRSSSHAAFRGLIDAAAFSGRVSLHVDDGPPAQRLDLPRLLKDAPAGTHLYVCGPGGFMAWVLDSARTAGWPEASLHREYFNAAVPIHHAEDGGFELELRSSGLRTRVGPMESVVQAVARLGINIPTSCEQGVCGTCLTRVVDGLPDHRDLFLTPAEQSANDQMLACCSRARTPLLVIDL